MRLDKRCFAFLLTCSLLLSSPRAHAGFMAQGLNDRTLFIVRFLGDFLSIPVSLYLRSLLLGEPNPKPPTEAERSSLFSDLQRVNELWDEYSLDFQVYFSNLILIPSFGDQLTVSPAELHQIAELAPGLAATVQQSWAREVHLPISGELLSLLVRIIQKEDLQGTINNLSAKNRLRLLQEARTLGCGKMVSLLKGISVLVRAQDGTELQLTPSQLQTLAEVAPSLATLIEGSNYHILNLPVSGTMLILLGKLVKDENTYDTVTHFETDDRERLAAEAGRLDCKKIQSLMRTGSFDGSSSSPRSTSSPRITPTSSPRTKKTNDNSHNIPRRNTVENQQHMGRERRHSITGVLSDLHNPIVKHRKTDRKEERKKKERVPVDIEPALVTVTEDLIPSDGTPLEQLLQYSAMGKDNAIICHYYPLLVTDEELVRFLKKLGFKSKEQVQIEKQHLVFAQALVTGFAEQGFPNGPPSGELLDVLRWILQKYNGADLREKFETKWTQAKGYSLDDEFVNFLKTLGFKNREHVQIASEHLQLGQTLVNRLAELGVHDGPSSAALVDVLRWIWENHKDPGVLKEYILSQMSVSLEVLNSIFDHTDNSDIAAAWTQSNVNLFRNLKPQHLKYTDSEDAADTSFTLVASAANNTYLWLLALLGTKPQVEKFTLSKRLLIIADIMLKMGDFQGALIIHQVLQKSGDYVVLQKTNKKMTDKVAGAFKQSSSCDFDDCKSKLTEGRSSADSTFLSPITFYQSTFVKLSQIQSLSKKIAELGAFLQMIHNDKSKAPQVGEVNPDLLRIFMKLSFLEMKT